MYRNQFLCGNSLSFNGHLQLFDEINKNKNKLFSCCRSGNDDTNGIALL